MNTGVKVLIIDDEPIHNFIAIRLFRQIDPEIKVFDFTDASLAISKLPEIDPLVIFLDLNMPKTNGWDVLDKLLELGLHYKVYILTSSVSTFDHDKAQTYSNVLECLEKPVRKEKLLECIARASA